MFNFFLHLNFFCDKNQNIVPAVLFKTEFIFAVSAPRTCKTANKFKINTENKLFLETE